MGTAVEVPILDIPMVSTKKKIPEHRTIGLAILDFQNFDSFQTKITIVLKYAKIEKIL